MPLPLITPVFAILASMIFNSHYFRHYFIITLPLATPRHYAAASACCCCHIIDMMPLNKPLLVFRRRLTDAADYPWLFSQMLDIVSLRYLLPLLLHYFAASSAALLMPHFSTLTLPPLLRCHYAADIFISYAFISLLSSLIFLYFAHIASFFDAALFIMLPIIYWLLPPADYYWYGLFHALLILHWFSITLPFIFAISSLIISFHFIIIDTLSMTLLHPLFSILLMIIIAIFIIDTDVFSCYIADYQLRAPAFADIFDYYIRWWFSPLILFRLLFSLILPCHAFFLCWCFLFAASWCWCHQSCDNIDAADADDSRYHFAISPLLRHFRHLRRCRLIGFRHWYLRHILLTLSPQY